MSKHEFTYARLMFGRYHAYIELSTEAGDVIFLSLDDWRRWKIDPDGVIIDKELKTALDAFNERTKQETALHLLHEKEKIT